MKHLLIFLFYKDTLGFVNSMISSREPILSINQDLGITPSQHFVGRIS
jgi:hypothetical protein